MLQSAECKIILNYELGWARNGKIVVIITITIIIIIIIILRV